MNQPKNMPVVQSDNRLVEVVPWLKQVVLAQLTRLVALGLPGMPTGLVKMANGEKVDVMAVTAEAWVQAIIGYYRELEPGDAQRLREGFIAMANKVRFWPKPVDLWPCVPEREEDSEVVDRRFQREKAEIESMERRLAAPPQPLPAPEPEPEERQSSSRTQREAAAQRFRALSRIPGRPEGMSPVEFMRTESREGAA